MFNELKKLYSVDMLITSIKDIMIKNNILYVDDILSEVRNEMDSSDTFIDFIECIEHKIKTLEKDNI